MESEIKHLVTRIESLEGKLDTLEERLTKYFEASSLLMNRIVEMQSTLTANAETHRNIHQRLDSQAQDLGRIFAKFDEIYAQIGATNSRLGVVETTIGHCVKEVDALSNRAWVGILAGVGAFLSALIMHLVGK